MKAFIYLLIGLLTLSACAQSASQEENAAVINQRVTQEEFKKLMATKADVQLIDVRTPAEFNEGTIENATMIDFNDANFSENIQKLNKEKPVMIFCRTGGRSGRALAMMKDMGFQEVYELEGGFSQWEE